MKNIKKIECAFTHSTVFHADDVFATALLNLLNPKIIIQRTLKIAEDINELDEDPTVIIYDIGLGMYDHHQPDNARRPITDGYWFNKEGKMQMIPYCSFGLLWRDYGRLLFPADKAWAKVDRDLVLPIDKADNGVERNTLSAAVHAFNPTWDSTEDSDSAFFKAVEWAKPVLKAYIDNANAEARAEEVVKSSRVIDGTILILDKYAPWQDVVIEQMPDILFCVYPSARGGYNVQTVPDAPGSFNGRKLFPTRWLGNPDAELGMTFCHPGNFLLSCNTLDEAIACARIAVAE